MGADKNKKNKKEVKQMWNRANVVKHSRELKIVSVKW